MVVVTHIMYFLPGPQRRLGSFLGRTGVVKLNFREGGVYRDMYNQNEVIESISETRRGTDETV